MQIDWFKRKFEVGNNQNILPALIERLDGTVLRLQAKVTPVSNQTLFEQKPGDKWSVKEQVGHLIDLEPLWLGRLHDILNKVETLREADLENTKTHQANHNASSIDELISRFKKERAKIISALKNLPHESVFHTALHPRLKIPMNVIDLFSFVADHDDHHLAKIQELMDLQN